MCSSPTGWMTRTVNRRPTRTQIDRRALLVGAPVPFPPALDGSARPPFCVVAIATLLVPHLARGKEPDGLAGFDRILGVFYFAAGALTLVSVLQHVGGPGLPPGVGGWLYPVVQPVTRVLIGAWLLRVAAEVARVPGDAGDSA